jgi:hypothetical protein
MPGEARSAGTCTTVIFCHPEGICMSSPRPNTGLQRASSPRVPSPTREQQRALDQRRTYLRQREGLEMASILRGLVLLAVVAMVASIFRAGLHRVFVPGWWHR